MAYIQKNLDPELLYYYCTENNDVITKPRAAPVNRSQGKITEELKDRWIEEFERTGQSPKGVIVYKNNEVKTYKFDAIFRSILGDSHDEIPSSPGDIIDSRKIICRTYH
jgi:hypothetical protein